MEEAEERSKTERVQMLLISRSYGLAALGDHENDPRNSGHVGGAHALIAKSERNKRPYPMQ